MDSHRLLDGVQQSISDRHELEYFQVHEPRYELIMNLVESLHLPSGAKILDIGCYPPHLFHALEKIGYDMWGISSKHEPLTGNTIRRLNIESDPFPFESNCFDAIIFTEVIEHLVVSPKVYLDKFKAVLKPGGYIVVTTPNGAHLKNRLKLLFGRNIGFSIDQLYDVQNVTDQQIYYRHNKEFTFQELTKVFNDVQFEIVDHAFFAAYTPFRETQKRLSVPIRLLKMIGYGITILVPSLRDSQYLIARKSN